MRGERGLTLLETLIVLVVVSLLVGLAYPGIGAGLDSLRLRSAADGAAGLIAQAMTRVERRQAPLELIVDRAAGTLQAVDPAGGFVRQMRLEPGLRIVEILPPIAAPGEETVRSFLLAPGEPYPALGIVIGNPRGQQRLVRIDPLTAAAVVETAPARVSEEGTR
ncbi:MAG: prepilin-type N-terminal cleavage/methylation domain-containing protein [Bryobacteraceae bacterium]|nr:prepilin-type N-terminal cleavage/methylation domain-containing protein [Bryobacteraceae bacterium]MCX7603355.1 prepilin-type N-terminal cleavage/methylation domain-containing protein [Bryobacteraceae bacterium]